MKKNSILFILFFSLLLFGCFRSETNNNEPPKHFPKPGSIVASADMPVTNDNLNHFTFSVKIFADSNIASGVYDVDAEFGPNIAWEKFTMPKGGESLKPLIRKGDAPYTYIIGFRVAGDTTFYDYFLVASNRMNTTMKYIKGYTFN